MMDTKYILTDSGPMKVCIFLVNNLIYNAHITKVVLLFWETIYV